MHKKKLCKLQIMLLLICSLSYGQNSQLDSAYAYFKKAKKFDINNKHFKAYQNYLKSKVLYRKINEEDSIAKCNLELFELITSQNNLEDHSKPYLDDYYEYALKKQDSLMIITSYFKYAQYFFDPDNKVISASYYNKILKLSNNLAYEKYKPTAYANLAYLYTKNSPDSADLYFKKTLKLYKKEHKDQLFSTYINYANFFQQRKNFKEAIRQLKKAEAITPTEYKLKYYKILYGKFANCYKGIGDYKSAYANYEKYNRYRDSLNNTIQNIAISDLDKKYKTAEKEKELLEEQQKSKERENLLIAAFVFILLAGSIALLMLKNSRRKRLIAEQEKALETQKNLTLLKEQEINTINAMVAGQEKERKRVAEDLHDNLGSVLATLKLHFENLQINNEKQKVDQEALFDKTENLIDEAYLKVRSIAHAKNAGVIANKGLLVAVQLMASKISSANKITIDVIHFGLDTPLENSLEITIFRIIQELITNILKHADATHGTINLSRHENNLNIIVEDNGSGFDSNAIASKASMGIHSIKTRIAHMQGEFVIDTTLGKGTTIIINIPLE